MQGLHGSPTGQSTLSLLKPATQEELLKRVDKVYQVLDGLRGNEALKVLIQTAGEVLCQKVPIEFKDKLVKDIKDQIVPEIQKHLLGVIDEWEQAVKKEKSK